MSREQVRKLLGGYATGALTPEERQALFEAALEDQPLFDALARDQSLRDLLRDPAARARLLAALGEAPATWRQRAAKWMWGHAVGLAAAACFVTVAGYMARQAHFTPPRVVLVATEPTTVDVNGSQPPPEPARPRRVFDLESVKTAASAPPEMPQPPVLRQPSAMVHGMPPAWTRGAAGGYRPIAAPALPPPEPEVAGQLGQTVATASARGGAGGGRGPTEQAVAAMAAGPVGAGKLDPSLVALVRRVRSGARPTAEESRFVSGGEAAVRMILANASPDSLAQLRKAGFTLTRQERNELTGRIAVDELEAVAQLAFVVWITPQ